VLGTTALPVLALGFVEAKSDTSLFIYRRGTDTVYLLLYVDDIILTASSLGLLRSTITALQSEFAMKDLGPLHHFLGIAVHRRSDGLFLSQHQYLDVLERAGMFDCKPCSTPVDTHAKLLAMDGDLLSDATHYRSLTGALQYLTHSPGHFLCGSASLPSYACSSGFSSLSSQADIEVS